MKPEQLQVFFKKDAEYMHLFELIKSYIFSLGEVTISISKTQVALASKRQFAWIWLPPFPVKDRPDKYIVLSFGLDEELKHRRIVQAVQTYPGRWMHHVIIEKPADFNTTVRKWTKKAYEFGLNRRTVRAR